MPHYVEADRSRADDYFLIEGSGLAEHYAAAREPGGSARPPLRPEGRRAAGRPTTGIARRQPIHQL